MTQIPLSPDDPRLTAYALGEMTPAERAEFEPLLQSDPAALAAVEDIRAASSVLAAALENEPAPAAAAPRRQPTARVIRFPHFYYTVSGLAAACFALFFVYWQRSQPPPRSYVEVDLARLKTAESPVATPEAPRPAAASMPPPVVTMDLARNVPPADASAELPTFQASPRGDGAVASGLAGGLREQSERRERDIAAPESDLFAARLATAQAKETASKRSAARARHEGEALLAFRQANAYYAAPPPAFDTEAYAYRKDSDYQRVADQPLSTFSIDVDTAAYANVRRFLRQGQRPPADAVRIEELINYFPYQYAAPTGEAPFAASLEVAAAPWAPEHRLVRIGLKGREVSEAARPAANLVFLLDVSGSMRASNKLPLVKQSLRMLVERLRPDDRVAIAVYAGSSGLALPSTPGSRKAEILDAIDRLEAAGSTNGALGIHLAYDIAKANFVPGGINRVVLATDGDFNVGTTSEGELVRLVGEKARGGVFLSVLGFGMGNLKDSTLEQIADKGNGQYAYIDSLAEARKALVEQAGGTLLTIAKDVKIQVEFNPARVAAYRLIGYENRTLAKEDFNNDKVDAGEIGAGHTVTALYEVVPAGVELPADTPTVDALKYQPVPDRPTSPAREDRRVAAGTAAELLTVAIRYKEPAEETSRRLEFPLRDTGTRFEDASQDFKFAAAVAAFGMALRDSPHKGTLTLADVSAWARAGLGSDLGGYRGEFLGLVGQAEALPQ